MDPRLKGEDDVEWAVTVQRETALCFNNYLLPPNPSCIFRHPAYVN